MNKFKQVKKLSKRNSVSEIIKLEQGRKKSKRQCENRLKTINCQ